MAMTSCAWFCTRRIAGTLSNGRMGVLVALVAAIPFRASAETEFHPSLEASATWLDNVDLVSDNAAKETEYVYQVTPAFSFEQKSSRMNSLAAYSMRNYYYQKDSERNARYHQFSGSSTVAVLSDYFFLNGVAGYTQQIVDPGKQTNTDLLFGEVVNISDVATASISPYFLHEFERMYADIRYMRGWVDFRDETFDGSLLQDVDTETSSATFGSVDDLARLTWQLKYEVQKAEYEISPPFKFESATAELGLSLTRSLRLLGRGGMESDISRDTSKGGLDYSIWSGGIRWDPSQRTRLQALYGERSFGKTYNVRFSHEARLIDISATYSQEPTTLAQELVLRPVSQQQAGQEVLLPDAANYDRATTDVYLRKDIEGKIEIKGRYNQIELNAFKYHRDYFATGLVDEFVGGGGGVTRQLNASLSLTMTGRYSDVKTRDGDAYKETSYRIGFNTRIGKKLSVGLTGQQVHRTGDVSVSSYKANWITLAFKGEY